MGGHRAALLMYRAMCDRKRQTSVIGVDTGGTFTDFVIVDESGAITVDKRPSCPTDPAKPVLDGLAGIEIEAVRVVHGTTVATNALLEHKVATTALITTAGFEDVLEIGRQNRPALYSAHPVKPRPLIPRHLRFGVNERILADGSVRTPLNTDEVEQLLDRIRTLGVEALAVCLLHSYANPSHEETIGEIASNRGLPVSLSCKVLPEFREYERTATVAVNACLRPIMEGYLGKLVRDPERVHLGVMQSTGGTMPARMASRLPVHTVLSGPAGGVIASSHRAAAIGLDRLITFDMGGTSTDVSLFNKGPALTGEKTIAGHPIRVPVIDIHTVGAGGGSIAFRDSGGGLKVGPASAGADPGPVCYGKGDSITVTDANLYLGRLDPLFFLGGRMEIHPERVTGPMEGLALSLGLDPVATAEGIITVVNAVMERAVRVISIQQGYDPREFTMVSFGGAGGLHAVELAEALSIPRVLVPKDAGVFSAFGMSVADVSRDLSRTVLAGAEALPQAKLDALIDALIASGIEELSAEGVDTRGIHVRRSLDMRYNGQSYEITVPVSEDPVASFHQAHEKLYGYCRKESSVEIVTVRVRLIVSTQESRQELPQAASDTAPPTRRVGKLTYRGSTGAVSIYDRADLQPGNQITGPALIGESSSTTFLPPGRGARVDQLGNLIISI
jgi:N-methylhydantoinase A